jgi:D-alanyl-D-alanine carboxypeptidase (penicillin-binding protein 5/6)
VSARLALAASLALAFLPCTAWPARAATPSLQARAAIAVESSTGDVAYARNATGRRSIASTTKLMTVLLALERLRLDQVLTAVPYQALAAESEIHLRPGERMTVRDLLTAALLPSANDAAATLATRIAGSRSRFVAQMNARARELGLRDTHYANPIGLDAAGNYSSAADLVKLATLLRRNAFFRATVDRPRARLRSGDHPRTVANRNTLIGRYRFVNGVKTGHTIHAGYVLVGSATLHGVSVVSAALGDPSEGARDADTLALLRYALARYRLDTLLRRGQHIGSAAIEHKSGDRVALVAGLTLRRALRRGLRARVAVHAPAQLAGPIPAGARVGTAVVSAGGREIARVPVLTAAAVPAVGVAERVGAFLVRPATLAVMAALVLAGALAARHRRRQRRRATRMEARNA